MAIHTEPETERHLLERFINDISNIWKSCICIGTGNEGATAGHTSGRVSENVRANREQEIELAVQEKQPSLNVQIWKRYVDQIDISIVSPTGTRIGPVKEQLGTQRFTVDATEILLYYGEQVHLAQTRRSIWISSHAGAI